MFALYPLRPYVSCRQFVLGIKKVRFVNFGVAINFWLIYFRKVRFINFGEAIHFDSCISGRYDLLTLERRYFLTHIFQEGITVYNIWYKSISNSNVGKFGNKNVFLPVYRLHLLRFIRPWIRKRRGQWFGGDKFNIYSWHVLCVLNVLKAQQYGRGNKYALWGYIGLCWLYILHFTHLPCTWPVDWGYEMGIFIEIVYFTCVKLYSGMHQFSWGKLKYYCLHYIL